ncbi:MAG TPA: hypothetical protein VGO03_09785 [Acidimicrobiia bacterium]|jgi:hypothetical protein
MLAGDTSRGTPRLDLVDRNYLYAHHDPALVSSDGGRTWHEEPPDNGATSGFGYLTDTGSAFAETGFTGRAPPAFAWSTDLRHWTITPLPFDNP